MLTTLVYIIPAVVVVVVVSTAKEWKTWKILYFHSHTNFLSSFFLLPPDIYITPRINLKRFSSISFSNYKKKEGKKFNELNWTFSTMSSVILFVFQFIVLNSLIRQFEIVYKNVYKILNWQEKWESSLFTFLLSQWFLHWTSYLI